jgi:carboxylesterase type B
MKMILFLFILPSICLCQPPDDTVVIAQGMVRGLRQVERNGMDFVAFNGIPYGAPPIGKLRFQPPQPAEGWNGTLEALVWPPSCVQFNGKANDDDPMELTTGLSPWVSQPGQS